MKPWFNSGAFLACLWLAVSHAAAPGDGFFLKDGQTVLFLGDSITFDDKYVQEIEAYLFTRFPEQKFHLLSRGFPGELATGTNASAHVPPLPDLPGRFAQMVLPLKPQVIVACYGMDDGLYRSPNEAIFAQYRTGIDQLIQRVRQEAKADLVLLSPPPFDPKSFQSYAATNATNAPNPRGPALDYDTTLTQFSQWLLGCRKDGIQVVDLHAPINEHLKVRRQTDPQFLLAGDGVHLNATGHGLMAQAILLAWNAPSTVAIATIDAQNSQVKSGEISDLATVTNGRVRFVWTTPLPMPIDPQCDPRSLALAMTDEQLNRYRLCVQGLAQPKYDLMANDKKIATLTAPALAAGIDLMQYPLFPTLQQSQEVLKCVQKRRQILLEVWVREDPHPHWAGRFKDSKATAQEAEALETQIRQLCQRQKLQMELVPVKE